MYSRRYRESTREQSITDPYCSPRFTLSSIFSPRPSPLSSFLLCKPYSTTHHSLFLSLFVSLFYIASLFSRFPYPFPPLNNPFPVRFFSLVDPLPCENLSNYRRTWNSSSSTFSAWRKKMSRARVNRRTGIV